jgi:hypothetical protein
MIEAFIKALQDTVGTDVLGYTGVWAISPLISFYYINQLKRTRKNQCRPLSAWHLRGLAALLSFVGAMFVSNRLAGWPLDRSINHSVAVAFSFPLLITVLLDRLHKVAPNLADEIGELPTEFRAADTTEIAPQCGGDKKTGP